jgi:alginate O-acetyltransferase complex protein AlgI
MHVWLWSATQTAFGAALLWAVARKMPATEPLLRGWIGMVGLVLLLHFGSFGLVALFWQSLRIDAVPIMQAPLRARSLSEFWGKRWNLGFRQLSYDLVFGPSHRHWGAGVAGFLAFIVSGLVHDLVISVPAQGGYGLPTLYFAIQGLGVAIERSHFGKAIGVRKGSHGWLFMAILTLGPIPLLFHRPFVLHVIIPFMTAIRAL